MGRRFIALSVVTGSGVPAIGANPTLPGRTGPVELARGTVGAPGVASATTAGEVTAVGRANGPGDGGEAGGALPPDRGAFSTGRSNHACARRPTSTEEPGVARNETLRCCAGRRVRSWSGTSSSLVTKPDEIVDRALTAESERTGRVGFSMACSYGELSVPTHWRRASWNALSGVGALHVPSASSGKLSEELVWDA